MFFTRTHEFTSAFSREEIKNKLLGKHVQIHNLDFEVMELEHTISIVPHAEQVEEIKTLPITVVDFRDDSGKTRVVVRSKMRQLDAGGPNLIVIFCIFLTIASIVLFLTSKDIKLAGFIMGLAVLIFFTFLYRLQTGYFDYVRKVQDYVKNKGLA
jgi:hypothetical protein